MSIFAYHNFAVKNPPRMIIKHSPVCLMRSTIRHGVINFRVSVMMLRTVEHIEAVNECLAALGGEFQIDVMPRKARAKIDIRRVVPAAAAKGDVRRSDIERIRGIFLNAVMCKVGVIADGYPRYSV